MEDVLSSGYKFATSLCSPQTPHSCSVGVVWPAPDSRVLVCSKSSTFNLPANPVDVTVCPTARLSRASLVQCDTGSDQRSRIEKRERELYVCESVCECACECVCAVCMSMPMSV